jgi:hypothetical protein
MTPPPVYKSITPDELAQRYRGRPFGELILYHVNRESLQQVTEELFRAIESLPNVLRSARQNWIDLNNSYALREEFWKSDVGDVLLSIVNRAKAFSASHGINADDDTLLSLFDIVVLAFAYTAHSDKRAKEFIQRSIGIANTRSSIFHRLFSRFFARFPDLPRVL